MAWLLRTQLLRGWAGHAHPSHYWLPCDER